MMKEVRIKFGENELVLEKQVTTLGRTPDNDVSFPEDPNISRYHAEIELRNGEYLLLDLNSSNGTSVNGNKISEIYLQSGDVIELGGSAMLEFGFEDKPTDEESEDQEQDKDVPAVSEAPAAPVAAVTSGGQNTLFLVAGGLMVVALLFMGIGAAVYFLRNGAGSGSCDATAAIIYPETGEEINEKTDIEIDIKDSGCVSEVIYTFAGIEFATVDSDPFTASIDPNEFADLSDGFDHPLGIILVDGEGNRIPQASFSLIAVQTREVEKPSGGTRDDQNDGQKAPEPQKSKEPSLIEVHEMAKNAAKQFGGANVPNVSNKQLLQEVQKKIGEFKDDGFFQKAANYRDIINIAYVREQNLDASLGFILAFSRSKFSPERQGNEEGLWRMNNDFVTANGYNGLCEDKSLSEPTQTCAANASALYMKAMLTGVFDGDILYSVAAFGKTTDEAGQWKAGLPENRSDIWNAIKTPKEREQLVNFLAAALLAENPQKYGMEKDKPLSELYRLTQ